MIKKWLERLFGIDKLRKELEEDRKKYQLVLQQAESFRGEYEKQIKDLRRLMAILDRGKIGVDLAFNEDRSWAIVCLGKTPEAVYFYQFPDANIMEINRFLREVARPAGMRRRNMTIDCPFESDEAICDRIYRQWLKEQK